MEFVPLKAEAEFAEAAEHRPPASADRAPGRLFDEERGGGGWFAGELLHLAWTEDSAGGGAVGAVAEFDGQADEVVVARFDVGEDKPFDDPDFWTEERVVRFDAVFVKATHREIINTNSAHAAIGDVFGCGFGDVDEVFVEGGLHGPGFGGVGGFEEDSFAFLEVVRL